VVYEKAKRDLSQSGVRKMASSAKKFSCAGCDHALVSGVACDGQFEECPYLRLRAAQRPVRRPHLYRVEIADLALPGEYDAVRSDS
jgi:hypothetical protein